MRVHNAIDNVQGGKGKGKGGKGGGKGKGKGKGGKGKGMKGGSKVVVEQHRHAGVFIARAKEDALCTLNSTPGKDVYGEKRISVRIPNFELECTL